MAAATSTDARACLIVLLGGDAGLRCGEMMALEWTDVDLSKRQLCVQRSDWKGHVTVPKGGRLRYVPLTIRLAAALRDHRHLRGKRVLCGADASALRQREVQGLVLRAARRANLANGGVHILRHTFCLHLAMRGAPGRAIQELAVTWRAGGRPHEREAAQEWGVSKSTAARWIAGGRMRGMKAPGLDLKDKVLALRLRG